MAPNRVCVGIWFALLPTAWGCDSAYETKQGTGGVSSADAGGQSVQPGGGSGQTAVPGGGGTTTSVSGGTSASASAGTTSTALGGTTSTALGGTTSTASGGTTSTASGGTISSDSGGAVSATTGGVSSKGGNSSSTTGGTTAKGGASSPTTGGTTAKGGTSSSTAGATTSATGGTAGSQSASGTTVYGESHSGQFHLGPVDFAETEWTNACSPYPSSLLTASGLGGEDLAGLSISYAQAGGACDACIYIETAAGRQITARVITYGVTNEPGDIDVSPSVYAALNTGEYPRTMTWKFAKCPDTGTLVYQFQTEANEWWTSLWVRNPRVPVTKVEVQSTNHATFVELTRGTDGTMTDGGGFGSGAFTLRVTAMDGQVITDTFASFAPGQLIQSTKQFQ